MVGLKNSAAQQTGVLLLAHGGPDSLDDVEPFLAFIRGGKPVSQKLLEEVRERYRLIGGRSPLLEISQKQARALEKELAQRSVLARVYLGMRNWRPFIGDTVAQMQRDGVERVVALCLAPQNSRKSVGLYFQHVHEAQERLGWHPPSLFVKSWHNEPQLISAFAEKVREGLAALVAEGPAVVVFTAHSLPEKVIQEGDPYDREVRETAAAVAERCGLGTWRFAYQSQGATAEAWLGPTVESVLEELAREGSRRVLIAPVGFVSDHVEVLYDVDIGFRRFAEQLGMEFRRTASLNDSPLLIGALASVVERSLAQAAEQEFVRRG